MALQIVSQTTHRLCSALQLGQRLAALAQQRRITVAQGVLQGVIGITAYSHAIRVLGVSKAVLFPVAVPAISVLIGIPIAGELPTAIQIGGLCAVTIGLIAAVGWLRLPRPRAALVSSR